MNKTQQISPKQWNYGQEAIFYDRRPNYAVAAIKHLCEFVKAEKKDDYLVADVGAGTANLTVLLHDKAGKIIAVEPTAEMKAIGMQKTKDFKNVSWKTGTGESTGVDSNSVNMVTFGSSFNTTDRDLSLKESHRILKKGGYFVCMWNNRDLEEPVQKKVEQIIRKFVPNYSHGTRREQQADVIINSKLFNHLYYYETPQQVEMSLDQFTEAWKSVKNAFWDNNTAEGKELLARIIAQINKELATNKTLSIKYVTKVWVAKRVD